MRSENWKGLITNASPYALPAGAATEQVNLQCHIPGQLITRGGMAPAVTGVLATPIATEVRDLYPFRNAGTTKLVGLTPSGTLVAFSGPTVGQSPAVPSVSAMTPTSGQVRSNYIGQFYEFGGEPPV